MIDNDDFIYATLLIGNTNQNAVMNDTVPAKGSFTSTSPILNKPNDYIGRIQRISISTFSIPLIVPLLELNQNNPNKLVYQFAMGYNGTYSIPVNVIFVRQQSNQRTPVVDPITGVFDSQDLTSKYYYIYYYSNFLAMWNTALATAYADLLGKVTPINPPSGPPTFSYDPSCGIVLQADNTAYGQGPNSTATVDFIQIYCGSYIIPLINGIPTTYIVNPTGCNYAINLWDQGYVNNGPSVGASSSIITLAGTNPITAITGTSTTASSGLYLQKQQSIAELCYWPSMGIIQVQSSMPVLYEINPSPIGTAGIGQLQSQVSNVLTDIAIDNTAGPGAYHSIQIFNNIDVLRVFNLTKQSPLYQIDAQIFWQDQFGRTFPVYLGTQESISIKYEFVKKGVYSNTH